MKAILTPERSRKARSDLSLSQAQVARESGISRSYVSLFESGRMVLPDSALRTLADFYEARGAPNSGPEESTSRQPANRAQIVDQTEEGNDQDQDDQEDDPDEVVSVDGFQVAEETEAFAEQLMARYHENDEVLDELLNAEYKAPWFPLDDESEAERKAIQLLAENALLIRAVRGQLAQLKNDKGRETLAAVLTKRFPSSDLAGGPEEEEPETAE